MQVYPTTMASTVVEATTLEIQSFSHLRKEVLASLLELYIVHEDLPTTNISHRLSHASFCFSPDGVLKRILREQFPGPAPE